MNGLSFARLFQRIFNRPLLIEPRAAAAIVQVLSGRMGISSVVMDGEPFDMTQLAANSQDQIREIREYSVENGIATVPIQGELVSKSVRLRPMSGLTGYSAIGDTIDTAAADQDVRGILLDIDSPGGELGAQDLADRIKNLDTTKPIWALLDDFAASAAYYIACAADRIVMPQEGAGASIGSIAMMADVSQTLKGAGITVHVVRSGEMKGKPNPVEGIDEAGLELIRGIIEKTGDDFVKTVAANRGLSQKSVKETKAAVLFGRDMLTAGLVDEIMPAHEARQAFADHVNRRAPAPRVRGTAKMAQSGATLRTIYDTKAGTARQVSVRPGQLVQMSADEAFVPEGMSVEEFAAVLATQSAPAGSFVVVPRAEPPRTVQAAAPDTSAAVAQAVKAERTRIAQIVSSPAAKGREVAALKLALSSDFTVEQATALLEAAGAAPVQATAAPPEPEPEADPFTVAMRQIGSPVVGPDKPAGGPAAGTAEQAAAGILATLPEHMRRKAG